MDHTFRLAFVLLYVKMLYNDDKFLLVALDLLQTSTNICLKNWSDMKENSSKESYYDQ